MEFLAWLENTSFATFVREGNTILAYPTVLFLHTLGLGTVAGLSTLLNLRVLGFARGLTFAVLTPFIPAIWVAFAVTAASGTALFVANPAPRLESVVFLVKLVLIALALATLHLMTKRIFRNPVAEQAPLPPEARRLALASMALWAAATTAGRLMAYVV
jgi:hypothetical protein